MNLILADDQFRDHLLPFTFTRPVADIRCGILTIRRKWELLLNVEENSSGSLTQFYLSGKYPLTQGSDTWVINGAVLPDQMLVQQIRLLHSGQQLMSGERILAARVDATMLRGKENLAPMPELNTVMYAGSVTIVRYPWDIFSLNDTAIRSDFALLTKGRKSEQIPLSNQTRQPDMIFIEPGAKVECAIINASSGPVYIGKNAEVMEGSMIRGPFALGDHAVLKMGAKIYGATTIGPGAKVGGEVSNSVIFGNSNKAHDGFLGNSVIGEWCNLGADTNNSNLKNNYSEVKVWNYPANDTIGTGLQFCGLFMGDHSKCGINTMFNTGTVVGVFANIFGAGFPDKFIPSFTWGGTGESEVFMIDKALSLAQRVMSRRGIEMTNADKEILTHIYLAQLRPDQMQ
jgi:UDP-N-acetylglucosamine diphosphorylase/glucosamine-1-phosphate N-acetyltransferase